jgi:hypothetical protein
MAYDKCSSNNIDTSCRKIELVADPGVVNKQDMWSLSKLLNVYLYPTFSGSNCWLNDQIIQFGDVIDVGGCRKCTCPPANHAVPFWRRDRGHHAICSVDKKCEQEMAADSDEELD